MSFEQKQYWLSGVKYERERIIEKFKDDLQWIKEGHFGAFGRIEGLEYAIDVLEREEN